MPSEIVLAGSLFFTIVLVLISVFLFTQFLGPQVKNNEVKHQVYESGITNPINSAKHFFNIKFYLVAILFVIFDVEVIFMLPWAVDLRSLGFFGLAEMFVFMGLLIAGLVYIYRKKALLWD